MEISKFYGFGSIALTKEQVEELNTNKDEYDYIHVNETYPLMSRIKKIEKKDGKTYELIKFRVTNKNEDNDDFSKSPFITLVGEKEIRKLFVLVNANIPLKVIAHKREDNNNIYYNALSIEDNSTIEKFYNRYEK